MLPRVVQLASKDTDHLLRLSQTAGWNQTREDWVRLIHLNSASSLGAVIEGRIVSTAASVCYGRQLAWIGMVLTDPAFRGRGLASHLLSHILADLQRRQIHTIRLDATDMGMPLYRQFGFEAETIVERWIRQPAAEVPASSLTTFDLDQQLDLEAFGASRIALLDSLAAEGNAASLHGAGYAMTRSGANAVYFGPCVSRSPDAAHELVKWCLALHGNSPLCWDLLPENAEAAVLASQYDFRLSRRLTRMVRTPAWGSLAAPQPDYSKVFAIAGFEYG